jgi:hypothetical protein
MRAMLKQFLGLLAVYVIALQAVLGVWAAAAQAGASADPSSHIMAILCRTASDGPSAPENAPTSHRVDCVCASACSPMPIAALEDAASLPSSPTVAVAIRPPVLVDAGTVVAWHISAQPRAPPIAV